MTQYYYYQVLLDGKPFPYPESKIYNKESAMAIKRQAENVARAYDEYKGKNVKVELVVKEWSHE